MSMDIFDALLELRDVADGAETSTASETGISLEVRHMGAVAWVIYVTAIDATTGDETYVFTLEVSDLVGGTYTAIATHTWPNAKGVGKVVIPVHSDLAKFQDVDSDWVRVTATLGGTTPSVTYGSYLTKLPMGNLGQGIDVNQDL